MAVFLPYTQQAERELIDQYWSGLQPAVGVHHMT